jgi:hypothetical protein
MTSSRAVAYIGGASLLAAWLASAAGASRYARVGRVPPPQPLDVALDAIAMDVQSQASRLRHRLAAAPAPQTPTRNPFSFAMREPPRLPRAGRLVPLTMPVLPDPVVADAQLTLLGVAEQQGAAGMIRTAMIGGDDDQLLMVVEGQEIAGRYRVTAVRAETVELKDLTTGAIRRLALK